MDIRNRSILVLGGWGLVGSAICRDLMRHEPREIVVSSLRKEEALDAVEQLRREYPDHNPEMFVPAWGNVFVREDWKEKSRHELLNNDDIRHGLVTDVFDELDDELLQRSALYNLLQQYKPDAVIDCINTATAIAYQDVYSGARALLKEIRENNLQAATVETLLASSAVPQLIRHVQILYHGLKQIGTYAYIKIGTSGTGGMGLNIPYTHSEERPSRVLLSKSSVAGAHTLLLFLMARTPDAPIVKELKPTAAIAWKKIGYGEVKRQGQTIPLVDMDFDKALEAAGKFLVGNYEDVDDFGENLRAAFIDTGENGIFSRGEFEAISEAGQMELITPEDIADSVVQELRGSNSGHDIVQALDGAAMEPTYRGGYMRQNAIRELEKLERANDHDSVAFEMLGPPRLSKLLYEAQLLKLVVGSPRDVVDGDTGAIAGAAAQLLQTNRKLRSEMLSIGLAILLPDGKKYLRGRDVKIPPYRGERELPLTQENIDIWCEEGWVDLRPSSIAAWQERFQRIMAQTEAIDANDTSSRTIFNRSYWDNFDAITPGKIAAWIFIEEDKGERMKD